MNESSYGAAHEAVPNFMRSDAVIHFRRSIEHRIFANVGHQEFPWHCVGAIVAPTHPKRGDDDIAETDHHPNEKRCSGSAGVR
jgi:hypothetical protein